jgi:hypothetical protein
MKRIKALVDTAIAAIQESRGVRLDRRQRRKALAHWHAQLPHEQLATFMVMLESNQELRERFRASLRGHLRQDVLRLQKRGDRRS